jgi:CheY-like chemotaxis protein
MCAAVAESAKVLDRLQTKRYVAIACISTAKGRRKGKPKYSYIGEVVGGECRVARVARFHAGKGHDPLTDASVISVVDDDQHMRVAIQNLLKSLGHHVLSFESAEAFLGSPRAKDTACLITDVAMSGLSGLELQRQLNNEGDPVSIIFITAYFDRSTERRALNAGAVCFLGKPFDSEALITCLGEALRRHRDLKSGN